MKAVGFYFPSWGTCWYSAVLLVDSSTGWTLEYQVMCGDAIEGHASIEAAVESLKIRSDDDIDYNWVGKMVDLEEAQRVYSPTPKPEEATT